MKTIYFVRHGESFGNVEGVFRGGDSPLSLYGEEQARYVADRCSKLTFGVIISSTMERAKQTASYIAEKSGTPIEYSDEFIERLAPTSLIGHTEYDAKIGSLHHRWSESAFNNEPRVEDSENFADIEARAVRALSLLTNHPQSSIVVVTHGFFMRMIAARIMFGDTLTPEIFKSVVLTLRTNNTGITLVRSAHRKDTWGPWMEGREWLIWAWNDHAHLG